MSSARDWPAFEGSSLASIDLAVERGIWGKMHGASSDYRWIARSLGLPPPESDLEIRLLVGTESAPDIASLWRASDDLYCAVGTYPSPARDASGRSGFLEKQILVCRRRPDLPAAHAALGLLPWARELGSDEWWEERLDPRWAERDFHLEIRAEARRFTASEIEERAAAGLERLAAAAPFALRSVYRGVLARRRPSYFEGLTEPLSPEAAAALLLPLPRAQADDLSIAGWALSSRYRPQRREIPWDILAIDRAPADEREEETQPEAEVERRVEAIVEAILSRDPERLQAAVRSPPVAVPKDIPHDEPDAAAPSTRAAALPTREAPAPPAPVAGETDEHARIEEDIVVSFAEPPPPPLEGAWRDLAEDVENIGVPFEDIEPLVNKLPLEVQVLVEFACSRKMWPKETDLLPGRTWSVLQPGDPAVAVLWAALRRLEAAGKTSARADLLRAAILILDGSLTPARAMSLLEAMKSEKVSPLRFHTHLAQSEAEGLRRRLGEAWKLARERALALERA